jgi:hypothetical protein
MAADTAMVFEGRRWPAAVLVGYHKRGVYTATGKGQSWSADRPLALWRSFSTLDLPDAVIDAPADARLEKFLNRHGDPTGQLDPGVEMGDVAPWRPLIEALRRVAAAWNEPDALGISSWGGDTIREEAADKVLRKLLPTNPDEDPQISEEIKVVYTRHGLTLWPQTLRAFMVISAASARERKIKMRQCAYCDDWFELRRSDAFYCSGSCQATDHKRRTTISNNSSEG